MYQEEEEAEQKYLKYFVKQKLVNFMFDPPYRSEVANTLASHIDSGSQRSHV